jgi:protease I
MKKGFMNKTLPKSTSFMEAVKKTGVRVFQDGTATIWDGREGKYGGQRKPVGPLVGKKVGLLIAAEFSDYQAYELLHYVGEFGGTIEWILVDWVVWKNTRPAVITKGVEGQWGLHVDPIQTIAFDKGGTYKSMKDADPKDYDVLVVLGNHSADIMLSESAVWDFVKTCSDSGAIMGAIGEGTMPYIRVGIMNGKKSTGSRVVKMMLERIGTYTDAAVVVDGKLITAQNTVDTPEFVRELAKMVDPKFTDPRKDSLKGTRVLFIAGEDYEDIEMCVPFLESLYRGAEVTFGTFPPAQRARIGGIGLDIVMGSVGTTIPIQEVPTSRYKICALKDIRTLDFDVIVVPGGFGPWNIVSTGNEKFLKEAYSAGKIVATICHGTIASAAAGILEGKKAAGITQVIDIVPIMGGTYNGDWSAVIEGRIVTARAPWDIPEFLDAITEAIYRQQGRK